MREVEASHRNYWMFGLIANVRNYNKAIYEPRGLPHDMSPTLAAYLEHSLEHTPGWLTLEEFKKVMDAYWQYVKKHSPEEYKNRPKQMYDNRAFYDIMAFHSRRRPRRIGDEEPSYHSIVNYCEELKLDDILLDTKTDVRLVFFFDS